MVKGKAENCIELLFKAFDNTNRNALLLIDTEGIILRVNSAFCSVFIYKAEEVVGKHMRILFTPEDQKKKMPEKEIENVIKTKQSDDNNYLVCGDGEVVWVSGESFWCESENEEFIFKVIQNVHDHKMQQLECTKLKNFNENILATIDDAVLVLDENKVIIKYNFNYLELYGPTQPVLDYSKLLNLVVDESAKKELGKKIDRVLKEQKAFRNFEVEIVTPLGFSRTFEVTGKPLLEESGKFDILVVLHDVSVIKEIQNDREDVLGFVAHELRNPMTNLKLCNEILGIVLQEHQLTNAIEVLKRSDNNIDRLNKLIADLYDATQIYGSNAKLDLSTFDVDEMIDEAVEMIEGQFPNFEIVRNSKVNTNLKADRFKLIQVVTNYLSNAIKYSGESKKVYLYVKKSDHILQVSVKDEGIGIPEVQLPYIFTRFFRTDKTRSMEGIGLGLYLCKLIIHSHHGSVWVESEEGKGSTFYFEVPMLF